MAVTLRRVGICGCPQTAQLSHVRRLPPIRGGRERQQDVGAQSVPEACTRQVILAVVYGSRSAWRTVAGIRHRVMGLMGDSTKPRER